MGYSITPIPFFAIDDSPIEIESASSAKFFNAKTLEELEGMCKGGGFYETDKANKAYYWKDRDGNFVEFTFKKEKIKIEKLPGGWFSFENVPQNGYIKIDTLRCETDRKALDKAKKLNPNYEYEIVECEVKEVA